VTPGRRDLPRPELRQAFGHSALLPCGDDVISINSFSKYFGMTGWRLGWMVLPPALVAPVEKLAQNLYICASSVAQHAALACFEPESMAEYERRRENSRPGATYIVPALQALGLPGAGGARRRLLRLVRLLAPQRQQLGLLL
jgi:aspartate/methionine/tyrosine aminotransferase